MRIILAGTGSAVGKTTIATGIMKALSERYNVQPFKVGPDYIDPSYHTLATGNTSRNLDSFFMHDGQVRDSYNKAISLVKSAAALVLGFKALDPEINIAGVILNKVKNKAHYEKTKRSIEEITDTEVIGGIIRDDNISIEQRHLGLVPARERENSLKFIDIWCETIKNSIDLDRLVEIAKTAPKINSDLEPIWNKLNSKKVKIGVAYDEVFNFYYKENIESLEANGAKVEYFSPLNDEQLPDIDGLYIGGGYPELFSKELSNNINMLKDIKNFHLDERPIFAECGGLMYLMKSIHEDAQVNVYPYKAVLTDRVQALKYTIAEVQQDNIISKKGEVFHGHEFHYSKVIVDKPKHDFAFKITRGKGSYNLQDGFMEKNTLASYVHTHVAAMPNFGGNLCLSSLEK